MTTAKRLEWKDSTSYSRNDKERIPRCWRCSVVGVGITVVFGHLFFPEKWVFHCEAIFADATPLEAKDAESAKAEAFGIVKRQIDNWSKAFSEVTP